MKKDLTGQKFGKLTVIKEMAKRYSDGSITWLCKCECGNSKIIPSVSLIQNYTQSCGCELKKARKNYTKSYEEVGNRRHSKTDIEFEIEQNYKKGVSDVARLYI